MSTLVTTNLKNPSSSGNNIVLNADGSTTPGLGKILQVQQVTSNAVQSTANTSMTDVPGMSVNITPTSSTSTLLCQVSMQISFDVEVYVQLIRTVGGSSSIVGGSTIATYQGFQGGYSGGSGSGVYYFGIIPAVTITQDAAVDTSQHTYQLKWQQYAGSYIVMNASFYSAFGGGGYSAASYAPSGFSSITVYEIGA